jgi:predicted HTH transcriptional regulator
MNLRELQKLVAQGEGYRLEFKRKTTYPDKIMREISAFANSGGGHLLIGVDDNGSIPGLKYPDEDEFVLHQALGKHCPTIRYELHRVAVSPNRHVLAYYIPPSLTKPVFVIYNFLRNTGRAYVRVADKSVQASYEMRQVLQRMDLPQQVGFSYGENEQKLVQYLASHPSVDVDTYAQIANLPRRAASDILVRLTLAHLLKIIPDEVRDTFAMREELG